MDDNFKIEQDGVIKPTEEEKPKPKTKARKAKIALRDDMYLAVHGLYNSRVSIKRGTIFFLDDPERIEKLEDVGAIRKVQDVEIKQLTSISKYKHLIKDERYKTASDILRSLDSEIASYLRIPLQIVSHIRKLIEDELSQIEE